MSELANYLDRELIDKEINLLIECDNLQNDRSIKALIRNLLLQFYMGYFPRYL